MFLLRRLITTCIMFIALSSNVYALSSNGSDGAFIVGGEVTLNVTDGQVFNFTTIDINSGGVLNLFGTTPNSSFSMLASGDINIAGLLNVYTNTNIVSAGDISITGTIESKNSSSISFSSLTLTSADVSNYGVVISNPGANIVISSNPVSPVPVLIPMIVNLNPGGNIDISSNPVISVPEPESYVSLLLGLGLICLARRKNQN